MTPDTVDTAALDSWLAEHLFGLAVHEWEERGQLSPFSTLAGCKLAHVGRCYPSNMPTHATHYSATGDGREMVERALIERGYTVHVYIYPEGKAWAEVSRYAPDMSGVEADAEHESTNTAVAQAARAALEVGR